MLKGLRSELKSKIPPLPGSKNAAHQGAQIQTEEKREEGAKYLTTAQAILKQQILKLLFAVLSGVVLVVLVINVVVGLKRPKAAGSGQHEAKPGELKIEVASKALDPEVMWRNHFEDKLIASEGKVNDRLEFIDQSLKQKEQEYEARTKLDLELMKQQLEFAKNELAEATLELRLAREQQLAAKDKEREVKDTYRDNGPITSHLLGSGRDMARPRSSRYFIPETAYVSGMLLGGISVSTGAFSSSEPTPVIIRVTSSGNLPKNFDIDLKTCRILGSSYGDLSSERAIIRAEVMSCTDKDKEQIITTKIAGMAFGDDGVNGIKGRVVQTSNKQVQHAFLGSLLSGFAGAAKSGEQFTLTSGGALSTRQPPFGERLKESTLGGFGSAGEKLADYYLKQAENMSPVLQIPAGSRVDVVFTKGVILGSGDVQHSIQQERVGSASTSSASSSAVAGKVGSGGDEGW